MADEAGKDGDILLPEEAASLFEDVLREVESRSAALAGWQQQLRGLATLAVDAQRAALADPVVRQQLHASATAAQEAAALLQRGLAILNEHGTPLETLPPEGEDAALAALMDGPMAAIGEVMTAMQHAIRTLRETVQATAPPTVPDPYRDGKAPVASNLMIVGLLDAIHDGLSRRDWDDDQGRQWPTHTTRTNRRRGYVRVSLRGDDGDLLPPDGALPTLWAKVSALGDWASDALCVCLALAETRGRGPVEPFWIKADTILDARDRKRITKAGEREKGWQHGHRTEDRIAAGRGLAQLAHLHLEADVEVVPEQVSASGKRRPARRVTVASKVVSITDTATQKDLNGEEIFLAARVVFGSWATTYWETGLRQTALLAKKALEYDPHNEQPEKRLAKYLAFQFKFDAKRRQDRLPRGVDTLLRESYISADLARPQRARDRLEKALNRLRDDGVFAGWGYTTADDAALPARGWLNHWLGKTVWLAPTPALVAGYPRKQGNLPSPPPS